MCGNGGTATNTRSFWTAKENGGDKRCRKGNAGASAHGYVMRTRCVSDDAPGVTCKTCPSGLSSSTSGASCEVCAKGRFTTVVAGATDSTCAACPVGFGGTLTHGSFHHQVAFTNANGLYSKLYGGAVSCTECPAGWFADTAENGSCKRCPAGWSSGARNATCTACAPGKYVADGPLTCGELLPVEPLRNT